MYSVWNIKVAKIDGFINNVKWNSIDFMNMNYQFNHPIEIPIEFFI